MAFIENIMYNERNIDTTLQIKRKNGIQYIETNKIAAIIIQRHYRGYYTRVYLSKLNLAAIIIQKYWKGYMARRYFNDLAIQQFIIKSIDYYNKAATIIQKHFKGYYTRKNYLDVKKRTKWINEIQLNNKTWSKIMQDYKLNVCNKFENIYKEKLKSLTIEMVYKHHPMLRTISKKGVFSKRENVYNDSEFEKLIRDLYEQINKKKQKN